MEEKDQLVLWYHMAILSFSVNASPFLSCFSVIMVN